MEEFAAIRAENGPIFRRRIVGASEAVDNESGAYVGEVVLQQQTRVALDGRWIYWDCLRLLWVHEGIGKKASGHAGCVWPKLIHSGWPPLLLGHLCHTMAW